MAKSSSLKLNLGLESIFQIIHDYMIICCKKFSVNVDTLDNLPDQALP